jgi:competence ComEA-like helix-hairpin-helix protein
MRRLRELLASCLIVAVAAPPAQAAKAVDGVVNINTAEVGVLGLLPGIGPAKAVQIVAYRKRRPFRTVDELVRIRGIGRKMVRRLRVHLAVTGPTTATGSDAPPVAVPPPAPARPPARPICVRPAFVPRSVLAQRQKRDTRPTHGSCPRLP